MRLHARQALLLDPITKVIVLYSSDPGWQKVASELQVRLGRRHLSNHPGGVYVCDDLVALKEELGQELEYLDGVTLCGTCSSLKPCRGYDQGTERAASSAKILTGEWVDDQWSWSAPQNVVDIAGVYDGRRSDALAQKLGVRSPAGGAEGLKGAFFSILDEEKELLGGFLKGSRKRVQRQVQERAGSVAAHLTGQVFDELADKGAQRLWEALRRSAGTAGTAPSGQSARSQQDRDLENAEVLFGLQWPYTITELEAAFRREAMNAHPDRGGSTERMSEVNAGRDLIKRTRFNG